MNPLKAPYRVKLFSVGTLSAFVSTIGFALQGLYTKKALRDLNIHQHLLLQYLSMYGLIMMTPLWLYTGMLLFLYQLSYKLYMI